MTDNPDTVNPEEPQAGPPGEPTEGEDIPPEPTQEDQQQLYFWVGALPFIIGAGIMGYQFISGQNQSMTQLMNAFGCLVLGLFVGAAVNAFAADGSKKENSETNSTSS